MGGQLHSKDLENGNNKTGDMRVDSYTVKTWRMETIRQETCGWTVTQ